MSCGDLVNEEIKLVNKELYKNFNIENSLIQKFPTKKN
jgi:hypothetical protein